MPRMETTESSGVKLHLKDEGPGSVGRGAVSTQATLVQSRNDGLFWMEDIRVSAEGRQGIHSCWMSKWTSEQTNKWANNWTGDPQLIRGRVGAGAGVGLTPKPLLVVMSHYQGAQWGVWNQASRQGAFVHNLYAANGCPLCSQEKGFWHLLFG